MEQTVKLAPDNAEYQDMLAHFYAQMGWRQETNFFTHWSIVNNLLETSASKMLRLAYKQLRRTEFDAARQSITEAMRIDPADRRGPAYMGLLIAGENRDRARIDETASWLLAACALKEAQLCLWGVRHPTPNAFYTQDQIGLSDGLVAVMADALLRLRRPEEATTILRLAIDAAGRVDPARLSRARRPRTWIR